MAELKKENLMRGLFGDAEDEIASEVTTIPQTTQPKTEDIVIPLCNLKDFHTELIPGTSHIYKRLSPQKYNEVKNSIAEYGILNPIMVRADTVYEGCYEIMAGHNRRDILKDLGWVEVRTGKEVEIVDATDEEAVAIMMESNRQRDKQDIMEVAWSYRLGLELLNRKAGRKGNLSQNETDEPQERSDAILAERMGTTRATLQRIVRLTYLIQPLQDALVRKKNKIKQGVGYELSFLSEDQQKVVAECVDQGFTISGEAAKEIRRQAEFMFLSLEDIKSIIAPKPEPSMQNVFKLTERTVKAMELNEEKLARLNEGDLQKLLQKVIEQYFESL